MTIEAMTQALAVLEEIADEVFSPYDNKLGDAILALRAAIEQAQDSVAWMYDLKQRGSFEGVSTEYSRVKLSIGENWVPLYTAPSSRQWQGLTEEEKHYLNDALNLQGRFPIIEAIEAKLKEKNHA